MLRVNAINRQGLLKCLTFNPKSLVFKTVSVPLSLLVGENIDYDSVQESNPYFKEAANLGFIFRPNLPVPGRFGHQEGDLYTEVIKYSELLKRAQNRNRVFIEKLEMLD